MGIWMKEMDTAHIHLPRDDLAYAAEVGLRQLRKRSLITEQDDHYVIAPDEAHVLRYYANSIAHVNAASAA